MKPVGINPIVGAFCCALTSQCAAAQKAPATETVLYSFASGMDGSSPQASLINVNGTLYGTTYGGGFRSSGTVFSVDPNTGAETVLHQFGDGNDGLNPQSALIDVKGTLYSTTLSGGGYGGGAVFALDPSTGEENTVYGFCSRPDCPDGQYPHAPLIAVKGVLYGTTMQGGAQAVGQASGTVFSIDRKTGAETVLHSFGKGSDGWSPSAGLIKLKGRLYGTTSYGGTYNRGTVFSLDPASGAETIVHSFGNGTDGANPNAGLIDVHGMLYGTTSYGGANSCGNGLACGTVFSLDPKTGAETVVYSFDSSTDGTNPFGSLIAVKGMLYGTTAFGNSHGTVFSIDPTGGTETTVHAFGGSGDGQTPYDTLIDVNGTLYGTTADGGASGHGTVFAITGF
jgi:uncharacterized repeat protein (TIGR03803 family)